jgi:integrase
VAKLEPPEKGNKRTYDSEVVGFGVTVTKAGHRSFFFRYRRKVDGRERLMPIGDFPAWSSPAARARAAELRRAVDSGGDPMGDLDDLRGAPTVRDLAERFEREHLVTLRPGPRGDCARHPHKDILPALGTLKVAAVTSSDTDNVHGRVTERGSTYQANRVGSTLSKMFSLAVRWRMRPDNPCKGSRRNQEEKRGRYLSPAELSALGPALAAHGDPQAANIFQLLLLTGARRGEVLALAWDQLDLESGIWVKPSARTEQKKEHRVPLSDAAVELLRQIHTQSGASSPWVFPSGDSHIVDPKKAWKSVLKTAGISGLRMHDLRHSYASMLVGSGLSLPVIGALLGHTQPSTTHRYAHLADDPLREATQRVGRMVTAAHASPRKVVPFART